MQEGVQFVSKTRINFAKFGVVSIPVDSIPRHHGCKFEFSVPETVISKTKQTTLVLVAIILKINIITLE